MRICEVTVKARTLSTPHRGPVPFQQQANALLPTSSCPDRLPWHPWSGEPCTATSWDTPAQGRLPPAAGLRRRGEARGKGRRGRRTGEGEGRAACVGRGCLPLVSVLCLVGLHVSRLWVAMGKRRLGPWLLGWLEDAGLSGSTASSMVAAPPWPACTGRSGGWEMLGVPGLQVRIPVAPTLTCSPTSSRFSLPPSAPRPLQGHTLLPCQHLPLHSPPVPALYQGPGLPAGHCEPGPLDLGTVL